MIAGSHVVLLRIARTTEERIEPRNNHGVGNLWLKPLFEKPA